MSFYKEAYFFVAEKRSEGRKSGGKSNYRRCVSNRKCDTKAKSIVLFDKITKFLGDIFDASFDIEKDAVINGRFATLISENPENEFYEDKKLIKDFNPQLLSG
ncbi:MAG: hypothetical protein LBD41_02010 [Clostridiales Family XIII bacterium]|jgi:hypothetical protein|nr:hypothetical protein [Clostridiales Family XIII bacterium]